MPVIPIPSLSGGVSRQPPTIRRADQVEEAKNILFSVDRGAERRPSTEFKFDVDIQASGDIKTHWIDRDSSERYLMVFNEDATDPLEIFDMADGSTITPTYDGTDSAALKAYLNTAPDNLRVITIGDITFVANTTTEVDTIALGSADNNAPFTIDVQVKDGDSLVQLSEDDPTPTPLTNGEIHFVQNRHTYISNKPHLESEILSGYYVADTGAAQIDRSAGASEAESDYIKFQSRWVDTADLLPKGSKMPGGARTILSDMGYVEVKTSSVAGPAGWYAGTFSSPTMTWTRFPEPNVEDCYLDPATMPIKITRQAGGGFLVEQQEWAPRYSGDNDTHELPPFVGKTIDDMVVFSGRMCFASGEFISMSEADNFTNFFLVDYQDVVDSDRIILQTGTKRVTNIDHLIPFNRTLVAFAQGRQFEVRYGDDILSPRSAFLVPTTAYQAKGSVEPSFSGQALYFPVDDGTSEPIIYEYIYADDRSIGQTVNHITRHVRDYIPTGITEILADEETTTVLLRTSTHTNRLYVYKYFYVQAEKVQSAWSYWEYDSSYAIQGMTTYDDAAWLLVKQGTDFRVMAQSYVPRSNPTGMTYFPLLDGYVLKSSTYNAATDETSFTLGYAEAAATTSTIRGVYSGGHGDEAGTVIVPKTVTVGASDTTVVFEGDHDAGSVYIGLAYESALTMSEVFVRDRNGAVRDMGLTQVKTLNVNHINSGYYKVTATQDSGATYDDVFDAKVIGSPTAILSTANAIDERGNHEATILGASDTTTVSITSDAVVPFVLASMEYYVNYTDKRR